MADKFDYPEQERLVAVPDSIKIPQCYKCLHYQGARKCAAFDEIPRNILYNFHDHKEPYPGDNGIRLEEKR